MLWGGSVRRWQRRIPVAHVVEGRHVGQGGEAERGADVGEHGEDAGDVGVEDAVDVGYLESAEDEADDAVDEVEPGSDLGVDRGQGVHWCGLSVGMVYTNVLTYVRTTCHDSYMTTTNCTEANCTAEFFLIEERGPVKNLCLTHGDAHMRANGHQNDLGYVVD